MSETMSYLSSETRAAMSKAKCDREVPVYADDAANGALAPVDDRAPPSTLRKYWEILNMEFLPANCHPGVLSIATPAEAFCERAVLLGILVLLSWALYALCRSVVGYSQSMLLLSTA